MRFSLLIAVAVAVQVVGCPAPPPPELIGGVRAINDPTEGWTIHIPAFSVPPGVEVQDCFFVAFPDLNGDGSDVWVDRFTIGQRVGSHHMNVFRVNTILNLDGNDGDVVHGGECRVSTNWADWPLVVNSQESASDRPSVDWILPEGVAQRFTPGELLMVQTHYVNADLQDTPNGGEVIINFTRSKVETPIEMGTLFATQQSIRICQSNPAPTYSGSCGFASSGDQRGFTIAAANGHFHSRGTAFRMYAWDGLSLEHPGEGAQFYESLDWDEPPMSLDLEVNVPDTGGIWWDCDYRWQEPSLGCDEINARDHEQAGNCCYTFGNSAEFSEHFNVFAYYWPKTEDIFCN